MSILKVITILCDAQLLDDDCEYWMAESPTTKHARMTAKEAGWHIIKSDKEGYIDICGPCFKERKRNKSD